MSGRNRPVRLLAVLCALVFVAAACGDKSSTSDAGSGASAGDTTATTAAAKLPSVTLNASGSSFQQAFEEAAAEAFAGDHPGVTVNYAGGGSGKGKQDLADGVVDFAGTDSLVKPEDMGKYGKGLLYFPIVAAPITVSYNLSVPSLKLDAPTLAKIFQREIKTWDDPAIKALNSGATLPATKITVAHRSDSSGTTENFTKYLKAAATGVWTLDAGSTVNWPADTQAGNGNTGVAQIVASTDGAVGYVDLADAKAAKLKTAAVKNKSGAFVDPTLEGASAALEGTTLNNDLTYSPLDAAGAKAYPITSPTWVITQKTYADADKATVLKAYLAYLLGAGQDLAADVNFARLPAPIVQKAKDQLDQIGGGAGAPAATSTTAG